MNVALFFTYRYSLLLWKNSGILDREIEIYSELNKKYGVKFTFVTYGSSEEIDLVKRYGFIKVLPIYTFINKSNNEFLNYLKSFLIPFKLKKYLKDVDLIKQHQLMGSWVSIIQKILIRKPLIVRTGYDMYIFSKKEQKSFLVRFLYFLLTFFSIKMSDFYTVSSQADLNELSKKFNTNEVAIRRNWIKNINTKSNICERQSKKILSVGRLEKQKNYEYSIKSLKGSGYILDIVGEGSDKVFLEELARKEGVNVNFIGVLDNEQLQKTYGDYKYFLLTSFYEGNPKVVIEAMSFGCVVLASDTENLREIIVDRYNGVLIDIHQDSKKLVSNLNRLENDEDLLNMLSTNSLRFIEDNYLLSNLVEKEFNDYKKLSRQII